MEKQMKATLSAVIDMGNGTFQVLQVYNDEVTYVKGKWKDRRTGKERSIIAPTGIRLIKKKFHNVMNYGRALMIADAITVKDYKRVKELTT